MKTQPVRRFGSGRWSFRSTVLPAWLFWVFTCAVAVAAGIGVAYFGSPDSGTPLETSAPAGTGRAEPSTPSGHDGATTQDAGTSAGSGAGTGGGSSGFAGGLSRFQGTPIQVLNASTDDGAADVLASRLQAEGFSIQVVETARRIYRKTTVFWTPGEGRGAAEALAEHFGWRSAPKPDTLTDSIPVHVVVGEDEST